MICGILKQGPEENRVAACPDSVKKLVALGLTVLIENDLGKDLFWSDDDYGDAKATVTTRQKILEQADILLLVTPPSQELINTIKKGTIVVGHFDPFRQAPLLQTLCQQMITSLSIEMVPRSSYAQSMDALSSQASLSGYAAVMLAAERIQRILPMMTTPAGTIKPLRVFVIGVGVAGLQAIATAKRLGARVEAFDTRPVVEEQVKSLGAKFIKIDLGETGQDKNGYAQALTEEQLQLQQQGMVKVCEYSDIVITTAALFGRPAPRLLTAEVVSSMAPGSVIVDMAAASGGNVEGTVCGEEVNIGGITIIGHECLARCYPVNASEMYSSNLCALLKDVLRQNKSEELELNLDSEIYQSSLITEQGKVVHPMLCKEKESTP